MMNNQPITGQNGYAGGNSGFMAMPGQNQVPGNPMPGATVAGNPAVAVGNPMVAGNPAANMVAMNQMAGNQMMTAGNPMIAGNPMMTGSPMPVGQNQMLGAAAMNARAASPVSPRKENPNSTQATLLISELRDGVVIMKDGSFRAVVACKSINFDLMSDTEREGVEFSYQNFLNSLTFTTQILIRSQRVDIGPYLDRLMEIRRNNDNMLLGVLMDNYINFVDVLAQEANIMDKSFFVIIPYYSSADVEQGLQQTKNFFKTFSNNKTPAVTRIDRATYDKAMTELNNRVETVMSGLFQIGIQSVRLKTKELAELYYNYNNPDTAVREPLVDFSKLATMYVRKGDPNERPARY